MRLRALRAEVVLSLFNVIFATAAADFSNETESPIAQPLPLAIEPEVPVSLIQDTQCFTVREDACLSLNETCRCKNVDVNAVLCCHIGFAFQLREGLGCSWSMSPLEVRGEKILRLHLINATLPDLGHISHLPLESLSVTKSSLENSTLPNWSNLTCLNFSETSLTNFSPDMFLTLKNLTYLDLSKNNMTNLPDLQVNATLDISGILGLECPYLQNYIKDYPQLTFAHENNTFCFSTKNFHWFTSTELVPLTQVQMLINVEKDCTPSCQCSLRRLDMVAGQQPTLSIDVDCSSLGLTNLPDYLPANTISLRVNNNSISSLNPLVYNKTYQQIREFYADSNQISSIQVLEGSKFLDQFSVLSVRNNTIRSLSTYMFTRTFDRNDKLKILNLGLNAFTCSCSAAQALKLWLLGNSKFVPDYQEIYCEDRLEKVIDLDINSVCVYDRDWTDYIYYIIAGEIALLLLLIGKVSYDYWVFKTSGYLPWPASKMPKLPCDWVFE